MQDSNNNVLKELYDKQSKELQDLQSEFSEFKDMSMQLEEELERNVKELETKLLLLENEKTKIANDYKTYREDNEK